MSVCIYAYLLTKIMHLIEMCNFYDVQKQFIKTIKHLPRETVFCSDVALTTLRRFEYQLYCLAMKGHWLWTGYLGNESQETGIKNKRTWLRAERFDPLILSSCFHLVNICWGTWKYFRFVLSPSACASRPFKDCITLLTGNLH